MWMLQWKLRWNEEAGCCGGGSSGTARLIVWGKEIEEVRSYRLSGMMVREFRGKKFLSTSKEMSAIESISDIGVVEEEEDESENCILLLGFVLSHTVISMQYSPWPY